MVVSFVDFFCTFQFDRKFLNMCISRKANVGKGYGIMNLISIFYAVFWREKLICSLFIEWNEWKKYKYIHLKAKLPSQVGTGTINIS